MKSPRGIPMAEAEEPIQMKTEGLTEKELESPLMNLHVYGMKAKGTFRDGNVFYGAESICREVGLSDVPKEELFKDWPEEHVRQAPDMQGIEWAVSRTGLLRLIAFGKNENAFGILRSIAEGLAQFDAAERVVMLAESARRDDLLEEKERKKRLEDEEVEKWEREKAEKKKMRSSQRKSSLVAATNSPMEQKKKPAVSFRDMVQKSVEQQKLASLEREEQMKKRRELDKVVFSFEGFSFL